MAVAISAGLDVIIQSTVAATYWSYTIGYFPNFVTNIVHNISVFFLLVNLCKANNMWYFRIVSNWSEDQNGLDHISYSKANFYRIIPLDPKWYQKRLDFKPDWTNISCLEANHESMSAVLYKWCCSCSYWIWMKISLNFTFKGQTWNWLLSVYPTFTHNITHISQITRNNIPFDHRQKRSRFALLLVCLLAWLRPQASSRVKTWKPGFALDLWWHTMVHRGGPWQMLK